MAGTETFGPFDTQPWADQTQWYRFGPTWARSGVIDTPAASASAGSLGVSFSGLTPTLSAGRAWVRGAGYELSGGSKTMPAIAANTNASLSRMDRIVLRRDLAAKTVSLVAVQGTPSSTPTAPALTQVETGQWDIPLFRFLVPPNSGTTITGIIDERVFVDPGGDGPRGLVKTSTSTSSTATSGTAEQRLSGPQNIVCTLFAGRTYEVIACGDVQSSGPTAGSILALRIRAAEGATPTTSSAVVAGTQVSPPTSGGAGEVGWVARGEFQVGTGGSDWQVHLFGKVLSVATALTVVPDGRGVHSISIYDRGPATTDVPSI